MSKNNISKESYKGVRDFYPIDKNILDYIKDSWKNTMYKYGYEEYDASILEPTELYLSKTSEEIVNDQTYTFTDRGERSVTLRPEMTPTVMRMVSGKRRELNFPLRWFSIPNVFRYEATQKGRLREHWQLNADLFGLDNADADLEMIILAQRTLLDLGLKESDFIIKINSRKLLNDYLKNIGIKDKTVDFIRLLDRKNKINNFDEEVYKLLGQKIKIDIKPDEYIENILQRLENLGINNVIFDASLARGFDYYTGIVFEAFSTDPEFKRSILGGGRYDKLSENYGEENIPVIGFGMGDVVVWDILKNKKLLPSYKSKTDIMIAIMTEDARDEAFKLAEKFREMGGKIEIDFSYKKIGQQISYASKKHIPYMVILGQEELAKKKFVFKDLNKNTQKEVGIWRLMRIARNIFSK